jgi:lycopene cyclase domain-containing protein
VPEYTVLTVISILAVVAAERFWLRTGIFRTAQYWWSIAIVFAFQIPVDGYLTKLSNPVVIYNEHEMLGLRFPWDIPVEDFGFGFSMVTLVLLLWRRRTGPASRRRAGATVSGDDNFEHGFANDTDRNTAA